MRSIKKFENFIKDYNIIFCHGCRTKINIEKDKYKSLKVNEQISNFCISCTRDIKINQII